MPAAGRPTCVALRWRSSPSPASVVSARLNNSLVPPSPRQRRATAAPRTPQPCGSRRAADRSIWLPAVSPNPWTSAAELARHLFCWYIFGGFVTFFCNLSNLHPRSSRRAGVGGRAQVGPAVWWNQLPHRRRRRPQLCPRPLFHHRPAASGRRRCNPGGPRLVDGANSAAADAPCTLRIRCLWLTPSGARPPDARRWQALVHGPPLARADLLGTPPAKPLAPRRSRAAAPGRPHKAGRWGVSKVGFMGGGKCFH
jgi:hypothetical protein